MPRAARVALVCLVLLSSSGVPFAAPVLGYGTYVPGVASGHAVAVDSTGIYLAGSRYDGGTDGVLVKLDPSGGSLLWELAIAGSEDDSIGGLVVDAAGDATVVLTTESADLPAPGGFQPAYGGGRTDGYVVTVDPAGTIVYGSFLGGVSDDGIQDVALDPAGRLVLTGFTVSSDFPLANATQPARGGYVDAFVTVLDADGGSLPFSTYLGGTLEERGVAVAVDGAGLVHVCGSTESADFPVVRALQPGLAGGIDAFVATFDPDDARVEHATYLGGTSDDYVAGIDVDPSRRAVVAGWTSSVDFPTAGALQPALSGPDDGFVTRLEQGGAGLSFSTYLGGTAFDRVEAIAVAPGGEVHVAGRSRSEDFPLLDPLQSCIAGTDDWDVVVATVATAGTSLAFSTFLGGVQGDSAFDLALDPSGRLWGAGDTSRDFPTQDAWQPLRSGGDAVLWRIDPSSHPVHAAFGSDIEYDGYDTTWTVQLRDCSRGAIDSWYWDFGDGTTSALPDPTHTFTAPGAFTVSLTVREGGRADTETKVAYVAFRGSTQAAFTGSPLSGVAPLTVAFSDLSTWAATTTWTFGDGATSRERNPVHVYAAPGSYDVRFSVEGPGGDDDVLEVGYVVVSEVAASFTGAPRIGRPPLAVQFTSSVQGPVLAYAWDFGDGGTSTEPSPAHTYAASGRYDVTLTVTGASESVTLSEPGYVLVTPFPPAGILTVPGPDPLAPPRVRAFDVLAVPQGGTDFQAYGTPAYGANVAAGDLEGDTRAEILTGPGPGAVFGPQVRAFRTDGSPLLRVNFFAYGTLRFGVTPRAGDLDAEPRSELLTGAGPGAVFGPHVRGFDDDGTRVAPIPGLSFHAYQTLRYGVNLAAATIAGDARREILTAPGPGPTFASQVRGFDPGPPLASLPNVNFAVFPSAGYGARVSGSDLDGDGFHEILASPGPGASFGAAVRGYDYDGTSVRPTPGATFDAFPFGGYGADPEGGDLDGDGDADILVARGPDPVVPAEARGFRYLRAGSIAIPGLTLLPYDTRHGLHAATADLGF